MKNLLLLLSFVHGFACAQTPAQQLERLAAEAHERVLDLFPFYETFTAGAGPRQDRPEIAFTAEHRARQRAHYQWVLDRLAEIPVADFSPRDRLTHELLVYVNRD